MNDRTRDNVIELTDRLPELDLLTCECGEAWWVLDGRPGAVALDLEGHVVARHGDLVCVSCGSPQENDR